MSSARVKVQIPEVLGELFVPHRYKVLWGGRGGAKSWSIARVLVCMAAQKKLRVLCARELQLSIQESVHKLLSDQIDALGLSDLYEVLQTTIRGKNGSEFIFSGIKSDPRKIKSMEGLDIVWIEEAEKVSKDSLEILIPTVRKKGSEIWISFNPHEAEDTVYQRFIQNPPPDAWVRKVGWEDNPWFPVELEKEKDYLYRVDPEAAMHVWGGHPKKISDAQVLRGRWRVEPFEPRNFWDGPYYGGDWGFATDPAAAVRCWVNARSLYVEYEAYGLGVEIDHLPALFDSIPGTRDYVLRADCARPEIISHMIRHGFPKLMACRKWKGSVEDGVGYLRHFDEIIIHPRCKNAAIEAKLYSFKVNAGGDVLPELVDKHNHIMDSLRYALEPLILGYKKETLPQEDEEEFPGLGGRFGGSWMS